MSILDNFFNRAPTKPGRRKIKREDTGEEFYATIARADEPTEDGTPINKALFEEIRQGLHDAGTVYFELGQTVSRKFNSSSIDNTVNRYGKFATTPLGTLAFRITATSGTLIDARKAGYTALSGWGLISTLGIPFMASDHWGNIWMNAYDSLWLITPEGAIVQASNALTIANTYRSKLIMADDDILWMIGGMNAFGEVTTGIPSDYIRFKDTTSWVNLASSNMGSVRGLPIVQRFSDNTIAILGGVIGNGNYMSLTAELWNGTTRARTTTTGSFLPNFSYDQAALLVVPSIVTKNDEVWIMCTQSSGTQVYLWALTKEGVTISALAMTSSNNSNAYPWSNGGGLFEDADGNICMVHASIASLTDPLVYDVYDPVTRTRVAVKQLPDTIIRGILRTSGVVPFQGIDSMAISMYSGAASDPSYVTYTVGDGVESLTIPKYSQYKFEEHPEDQLNLSDAITVNAPNKGYVKWSGTVVIDGMTNTTTGGN